MTHTATESGFRTAHTNSPNGADAAREICAELRQKDTSLVVFFCSSHYDLEALSAEIHGRFDDAVIIGCTAAGEIGPAGYRNHSMSGFSLSSIICHSVAGRLNELHEFDAEDGKFLVRALLDQLTEQKPSADPSNTFAILLTDGLSKAEETVTRTLQLALGEIPMVGGSAGDDLRFESTWVYLDGAFYPNSAVLAVVSTDLPFCTFRTQHFESVGERMVVTAADPGQRTVYEINGLPAVEEYARIVGVSPQDLNPLVFAAAPVVVVLDGSFFVRSIQKSGNDGSLTFFSAIEEGLVLQVAQGIDIVGNLERTIAAVTDAVGPLQLVITFDCILRNLEIQRAGLLSEIEAAFRSCNAVGFSTYGEQIKGVHVNQTLAAIAIGQARDECDE